MTAPAPTAMTRLLDAAEALIAEEGWAATTTRRVAERAGLTQGLVHYHARSIDDLRRDATIRAIRRFFDQPMDPVESTPQGEQAWLMRLLSPGDPDEEGARGLRVLHESLPAATRDDRLRAEIATLLDVYRERIAAVLRADGLTPSQASAVAATIAAAVDGAILQRSLDPDFDVTPIAEVLASVLRVARAGA